MKKFKYFNFIDVNLKLVISLTSIFILSIDLSLGQSIRMLYDTTNLFLAGKVVKFDLEGGVIYFDPENSIEPGSLFSTFKDYTGLNDDDEMINSLNYRDSIPYDADSWEPNLFRSVYQHYYKGIIVESSKYTEIHDGTHVWAIQGGIVENLNLSVIPNVSAEEAFNLALSHINCETYSWDSTNSDPPIGELVIAYSGGGNISDSSDFFLAWKFLIEGLNPVYNNIIYINANDGSIIMELPTICSGSFNHIYYGTKYDLDTKLSSAWWRRDRYHLYANDDSRNIMTTDRPNYQNKNNYTPDLPWDWEDMVYSAGDDVWGNDNWSATAAHYCASKTWDFYKNKYNQNGTAGWGNTLRVVGDYDVEAAAYSKGNSQYDHILVGRHNGQSAATYDIIGHEFTHGIDNRRSQMNGVSQAGAIEEAIGDIMGFMVERYTYGYVDNWTIGEMMGTGNILRDMQNPGSLSPNSQLPGLGFPNSYPKYYLDTYWYTGSNDHGGVHINCTVIDHWFYLLSQGGTVNVGGLNRTATGIGIDKAARIVYYTLISGLSQSETFTQFRGHTLAAAASLYGLCSNEYNRVAQAWWTVNVGTYIPCATLSWFGPFNNLTNNVEQLEVSAKLIVFPNPTKDQLNISIEEINNFSLIKNYDLTIRDIQGKKVFEMQYNSLGLISIDISSFVEGVYTINIFSENWNKSVKFIKN